MLIINLQVSKDEHVSYTEKDGKLFINVRIQEAGVHGLKIYGEDKDNKGSLEPLFNYIIDGVMPLKEFLPFPKQWDGKFEVYEPRSGWLGSNKSVHFTVKVPKAKKVAVLTSKVRDIDNCSIQFNSVMVYLPCRLNLINMLQKLNYMVMKTGVH